MAATCLPHYIYGRNAVFPLSTCVRGRRILFNASKENAGTGLDSMQMSFLQKEKEKRASTDALVKLFNDAQENLLYLNKQRIVAVEELQKVQRERELLLARISQLEAENQAVSAECDVLQKKLSTIDKKSSGFLNYDQGETSVWSELLLRIDSMALTGIIKMGQAAMLRGLVLNRDVHAAEVFASLEDKDDHELARCLLQLLDPQRRHGLHIMHICTEMAPLVQLSTLGSFIISLGRAMRRKGNTVEVILPKYASIDWTNMFKLSEITDIYSFFNNGWHKNKIWTGIICGIPVTLIEPFHPGGFFSRDNVYGYPDDLERFTYFSRAALEYILKSGKKPDIIHLHNWHTAVVAPLFWDIFAKQGLEKTRIVLTCHDFGDQCVQEPGKLGLCGLDPHEVFRSDRFQDDNDPKFVNLLKGGVVYSNRVTTLSPVYADNLSVGMAHGLESTLRNQKNKLVGIYNGLDESCWNPKEDSFLPFKYSTDDLSGKACCKEELRQRLGFRTSDRSTVLIGCVAPQVSESEMDVIEAAIIFALHSDAQFVFVGASATPHVQNALQHVEQTSENENIQIVSKYDEALVHLTVAASDILVCTSSSECSQMPLIGMKYGAIPVTRQVQGAAECVVDAGSQMAGVEGTGFLFSSYHPSEITAALGRALDRLNKDPEGWQLLVKNAMSQRCSWDGPCADNYLATYRSTCGI